MVALPEKVLWICFCLSGAALCSSTLQSGGEGVKETLPCAVEAVAVFPLPTVGGWGEVTYARILKFNCSCTLWARIASSRCDASPSLGMSTGMRPSGQPGCPGCRSGRLLATLSETLRREWRLFEGVCWSWYSGRQAYWHLCVPCHNEVFSHLPRALRANRYNSAPTLPGWQRPEALVRSVSPRFTGDFYLTAPPPERWTPAALEQIRLGLDRRAQLERQGLLRPAPVEALAEEVATLPKETQQLWRGPLILERAGGKPRILATLGYPWRALGTCHNNTITIP